MGSQRLSSALTLYVPERGQLALGDAQRRLLETDPLFYELSERGIVRLEVLRGESYLKAEGWVGRAQVGPVIIHLVEKIPGALAYLVAHATRFRTVPLPAPATEAGPLVALLARHFLDAAQRYLDTGLHFDYHPERWTGTRGGGRLDLAATIRLRARGRPLLAGARDVLTYDTPLNRLLHAALLEVVWLAAVREETRRIAATLAHRLGQSGPLCPSDLQALECVSEERDLVTLAQAILAQLSVEPGGTWRGTAPWTWFLNLEELFERAIGALLRDNADGWQVYDTSMARPAPQLFDGVADRYRVKPDMILQTKSRTVVGDVKYKTWTGAPARDDVYQLVAHAVAWGADRCFLVYPHTSFEAQYLGRTRNGVHAWFFALDIRDLAAQVAKMRQTVTGYDGPQEGQVGHDDAGHGTGPSL
jgi:5-methylcytosine-specific restriction endonuclease McrBC regulatory subunit McrC